MKYLSGDLPQKKAGEFNRELESNEELRAEFNMVKMIYNKLTEILSVQSNHPVNKEQLIREIIIEQDVHQFGGPPRNIDEKDFISKLKESMNQARKDQKKRPGPLSSFSVITLLYLAIAATVAFFLIWLFPAVSSDQIHARFYNPGADKALLLCSESTRGDTQTGIAMFYNGYYQQSMELLKPYIQDDHSIIKLFYALACIESGCEEDLEPLLKPESIEMGNEIETVRTWYYGLYLLRKGDVENSRIYLNRLTVKENPYYQKAKRLLRKID
ncbi:MAG TPA: hypothetical protein ENN58_01250 [bacterium]|nr:hypothetical protein [bacterium]